MVTFDEAFANTKQETRASIKQKLQSALYSLEGDLDDTFMGLTEQDMKAAGLIAPEITALRYVLKQLTEAAAAAFRAEVKGQSELASAGDMGAVTAYMQQQTTLLQKIEASNNRLIMLLDPKVQPVNIAFSTASEKDWMEVETRLWQALGLTFHLRQLSPCCLVNFDGEVLQEKDMLWDPPNLEDHPNNVERMVAVLQHDFCPEGSKVYAVQSRLWLAKTFRFRDMGELTLQGRTDYLFVLPALAEQLEKLHLEQRRLEQELQQLQQLHAHEQNKVQRQKVAKRKTALQQELKQVQACQLEALKGYPHLIFAMYEAKTAETLAGGTDRAVKQGVLELLVLDALQGAQSIPVVVIGDGVRHHGAHMQGKEVHVVRPHSPQDPADAFAFARALVHHAHERAGGGNVSGGGGGAHGGGSGGASSSRGEGGDRGDGTQERVPSGISPTTVGHVTKSMHSMTLRRPPAGRTQHHGASVSDEGEQGVCLAESPPADSLSSYMAKGAGEVVRPALVVTDSDCCSHGLWRADSCSSTQDSGSHSLRQEGSRGSAQGPGSPGLWQEGSAQDPGSSGLGQEDSTQDPGSHGLGQEDSTQDPGSPGLWQEDSTQDPGSHCLGQEGSAQDLGSHGLGQEISSGRVHESAEGNRAGSSERETDDLREVAFREQLATLRVKEFFEVPGMAEAFGLSGPVPSLAAVSFDDYMGGSWFAPR